MISMDFCSVTRCILRDIKALLLCEFKEEERTEEETLEEVAALRRRSRSDNAVKRMSEEVKNRSG